MEWEKNEIGGKKNKRLTIIIKFIEIENKTNKRKELRSGKRKVDSKRKKKLK